MGIPWAKAEEEILIKMAESGALPEDCVPVFPYRTKRGILDHAREIGHPLTGPKNEINQEAFKEFMKSKGVKPWKQPAQG